MNRTFEPPPDPAGEAPTTYEFGDFRVDVSRGLLWSQVDKTSVPVTPRVFETLCYFLQHPGTLLTRDVLMDRIWPDADVEPNNLSQNVSTLRRLLGEAPGESRFIATVPGRGYRFVAPVRTGSRSVPDIQRLRPTQDLQAYRLYLQALRLLERPTAENLQLAISQLEQAAARDTGFAQAWCWLADARMFAVNAGHSSFADLGPAERDAQRAIELHPGLATPHAVLANIRVHRGDWVDAEAQYQRALSLDDSDAMARTTHASFVLLAVGCSRQGLIELECAYALSPADPRMLMNLAAARAIAGDDAQALQAADLAVKFGFPPHQAPIPLIYQLLDCRAGRFSDAAEHVIRMRPPIPATPEAIHCIYAGLSDPGARPAAVATLRRLIDTSLEDIARTSSLTALLVSWLTQLGERDLAFELADRAIEVCRRVGVLPPLCQLLWLPELLPLRRDPRFPALARRFGFPDYWLRFGPPDRCRLEAGELVVS